MQGTYIYTPAGLQYYRIVVQHKALGWADVTYLVSEAVGLVPLSIVIINHHLQCTLKNRVTDMT